MPSDSWLHPFIFLWKILGCPCDIQPPTSCSLTQLSCWKSGSSIERPVPVLVSLPHCCDSTPGKSSNGRRLCFSSLFNWIQLLMVVRSRVMGNIVLPVRKHKCWFSAAFLFFPLLIHSEILMYGICCSLWRQIIPHSVKAPWEHIYP